MFGIFCGERMTWKDKKEGVVDKERRAGRRDNPHLESVKGNI